MVTGVPGDSVTLSRGNRIDRNLFEGKKELGNFITVEGTKRFAPAVSQYDTIEFNHFRDIGPRAENVLALATGLWLSRSNRSGAHHRADRRIGAQIPADREPRSVCGEC